jgi:HAD superfamily hydrolase (TIGR01509 family)
LPVRSRRRLDAKAWKKPFDAYLADRGERRHEELVPFDIRHDYDLYVDGRPRDDGVRTFLASRGITLPEGTKNDPADAETVNGLANRKNELVLELLRKDGVKAFPGSMRFLTAVREHGLRTAVVSASKNCEAVVQGAGIADLLQVRVDGIVAEEMHLRGKPSPDTFLAAARMLSVDPANAAVFEDALAGVEADVVVSDLAELLDDAPDSV